MDHLTLGYGSHVVIQDLSFAVNQGDFLVIVGENGVGKTTLVRSLLGFLEPQQGTISKQVGLKIGYVPQFRNLDTEYPLSIRDFVALNLPPTIRPWLSHRERQKVQQTLEQTKLADIADRPLGLASGGEKQRAYLAQALLASPQLLIMDESTASLDNEMKFELLDLVSHFQQRGLSVMFITHDWELARYYGTRYLRLLPRRYEQGPINELPQLHEEGDE